MARLGFSAPLPGSGYQAGHKRNTMGSGKGRDRDVDEEDGLGISRSQYDGRKSALRDDESEVDKYDVSGVKDRIETMYAIGRTDSTFDQANKGSATLGMWREVRPTLSRLTMFKAAYLRRTHLQLYKHY